MTNDHLSGRGGKIMQKSTLADQRGAQGQQSTALQRLLASRTWLLIEVVLVLLWAAWVGREYLSFDTRVWPTGGEYGMVLQSQFAWDQLQECGTCVFWNGYPNGGHPTFVDLHGAVLHPLTILTTLIWGAVNSSKLIIVCSFAMAGLAQWWMAKSLGLGSMARLWSAALAASGGHLAGRLDAGLYPLLLSAASVSLTMAASLALSRRPSRRGTAALGVCFALAMLSGQAYMQIGMLLSLVPAWAVLIFDGQLRLRRVWGYFALATGIGVLMSAVLWVPTLHFLPQMAKWLDSGFTSAQPLKFAPLNFVISDPGFFKEPSLAKQPYPFLYVNYVGWIPVCLAAASLRLAPKSGRRWLAFLLASLVLALVASSAMPLKALAKIAPGLISGIRNPSLMSSLAVPPLLAMAAWGLDRLLNWQGLRIMLTLSQTRVSSINVVALIAAAVLVMSLRSTYWFGRNWLRTIRPTEIHFDLVSALPTDGTQLVAAPYGEHVWNPIMAASGLKASKVVLPWHWGERTDPGVSYELRRAGSDIPEGATVSELQGDMLLLHYPDQAYAAVKTASGQTQAHAKANGGRITVRCTSSEPGTLVVQENYVDGWVAWRDGIPVPLGQGPWLTVDAPAGEHAYLFEYRPWDVWLGIGLASLGLLVALVLCLVKPRAAE